MILRTFVFLGALLLFSGGSSVGRAQNTSAATSGSQSDSLGDAARKARAEKKHSGKPAKVFTNDDMGRLKDRPSAIAFQSAPASWTDRNAETTKDKKPTNGDDRKKDEASWRAKFAAARKTLADDMRELDILQREFNLKQQQFYQDPNAALKQQYNRDDLNKTQSEIDTKKQAVERDKQALSDLEDELRKAGGDPGWASEPSR
jgi:chromosome segregation ATPase